VRKYLLKLILEKPLSVTGYIAIEPNMLSFIRKINIEQMDL